MTGKLIFFFDFRVSASTKDLMTMRNVGLYWFGNDLRVHDNANLLKAACEVNDLLCIYCVDPQCVKQRGKMSRGSGKTASKTVHPDMCHDPVFCRRNLGCYLWILLPKSEGVIL